MLQGIDAYKQIAEPANASALVSQHGNLVIKIAKKMSRGLPSHIELEDLIQSGYVGLLEASSTYQESSNATFETYASQRIKGAILDDLRKNSWSDRETIKWNKQINQASQRLEQKWQRRPTSIEIAEELGISYEEYDEICQRLNVSYMITMNENDSDNIQSENKNPEEVTLQEDIKKNLKQFIAQFPEREQILLSLYYIEELNFKEIGAVLGITEARVSQLHAAMIAKLMVEIKQ